MNLSAISSSPFVQGINCQPEASEVRKAGADNDGDADDSKRSAGTPSVNINGQLTGQTINVTA